MNGWIDDDKEMNRWMLKKEMDGRMDNTMNGLMNTGMDDKGMD